jgi:hypothetical protein
LVNVTCTTSNCEQGNRQNPEYHVVIAIRRLRTDKNCPAKNTWPNHVKNEQHIGSNKIYGPKKTKYKWCKIPSFFLLGVQISSKCLISVSVCTNGDF